MSSHSSPAAGMPSAVAAMHACSLAPSTRPKRETVRTSSSALSGRGIRRLSSRPSVFSSLSANWWSL
ncbi:MAG: hypothetical protein J6U72_00325, partial [Clostridia bacterium]|nr:hypothetical protein [Clostridia bacterium]